MYAENFLSPPHMGGEWVSNTLGGEAGFSRGAGQGQVTSSSPAPRDTRPHLLSFRHQALRSSCSRTNQALPPLPVPRVSSPNPTAQLYLHPRVCQRVAALDSCSRVSLNCSLAILGSAPACMRHFHTHTLSQVVLAKSPVMYYVLCTDKRKPKAQLDLSQGQTANRGCN